MQFLKQLFSTEKSDKAIYKKLGYALDQEGILRRFLREEQGWRAHLEHSKQCIREFYAGKQYKSIAIFGSGWLLDVPIDDLLHDFEQVYLCDISHPRQITHKYRNYENVHFVECDITGGYARHIYNCLYKKHDYSAADIFDFTPQPLPLPPSLDCVVSLNLLDQLDTLLLEALDSNLTLNNEEITQFRTLIQTQHIAMLAQYSYCLICDWEEISHSKITDITETKPLVFTQAPLPPCKHEWVWKFDSQGNYEPDNSVQFRVKAFFD
ncbi:MAG: hypothetical protein LBM68_00210 [Bacteroidales bacterium]|jgi:hypothetical protein|nr:hypothetical protein [Bacteroidales bacterium]